MNNIIYNTNIFINYHNYNDEYIYKTELLKVFNQDNFNDDNINNNINILFEIVKNNKEFIECIKKASSLLLTDDLLTGFMVLFSYNYFYITHQCICDIINDKVIQPVNLNNLKNILN